jgi:hypothetical protein
LNASTNSLNILLFEFLRQNSPPSFIGLKGDAPVPSEEQEQSAPSGAESDNAEANKNAQFVDVNTKFRSYVTLQSNLDNLIWRNVSVMLTSTAIGGGLIGTLLSRKDLEILGFTHQKTVALSFLLLATLYFISIFTLRRMRVHHLYVENHLRTMERSGYFHDRKHSVRKFWISAPTWNIIVFGLFGFACLTAAAKYWFDEENPVSKTWINSEQAASQFGILSNHERMENGELRFRLMGSDGNGYIRMYKNSIHLTLATP